MSEKEYNKLRKEIIEFINWQIDKDLIDFLTINYEMAESYLDWKKTQKQDIVDKIKNKINKNKK